jgi:predicted nucleic acid-binding protein
MTGRLFFDTSILIYAIDRDETEKRPIAVEWLRRARDAEDLVISPQVLNECYNATKWKMPAVARDDVRQYLRSLFAFCQAPMDRETTAIAWTLQDGLDYSLWDCLLLASALQSDCSIFVTEDLASGTSVGSLRIVDPFLPDSAGLLEQG